MPFTPYHMGPGMLFKAAMPAKFSLLVYGWSQIVMDIEPLIQISRGEENWHGVTHNLAGAAALGAAAAVSGKYLVEWGLRLISLGRWKVRIRWKDALLTGWMGSFSHILVDAFLHRDMRLFWPLPLENPFLQAGATWAQVEIFCLACGLAGGLGYLIKKILAGRKKASISTVESVNDKIP